MRGVAEVMLGEYISSVENSLAQNKELSTITMM